MTDHRINLTLYKLDAIMQGDLDELLDSLLREHQADLMASVSGEDWWLKRFKRRHIVNQANFISVKFDVNKIYQW